MSNIEAWILGRTASKDLRTMHSVPTEWLSGRHLSCRFHSFLQPLECTICRAAATQDLAGKGAAAYASLSPQGFAARELFGELPSHLR
jgi:hypothetical protein